ncbi:receptor-type tyrosine-protein phosphatase epsilon-like isoform X2 [Tribolium castaneum]|uniref:receptor-type tyrosine-protein phosphatase epsilon-like isoform X2 n=1 Tax=Tribolium castaneum TaxID=7070 RepID=UPI0030FE2988
MDIQPWFLVTFLVLILPNIYVTTIKNKLHVFTKEWDKEWIVKNTTTLPLGSVTDERLEDFPILEETPLKYTSAFHSSFSFSVFSNTKWKMRLLMSDDLSPMDYLGQGDVNNWTQYSVVTIKNTTYIYRKKSTEYWERDFKPTSITLFSTKKIFLRPQFCWCYKTRFCNMVLKTIFADDFLWSNSTSKELTTIEIHPNRNTSLLLYTSLCAECILDVSVNNGDSFRIFQTHPEKHNVQFWQTKKIDLGDDYQKKNIILTFNKTIFHPDVLGFWAIDFKLCNIIKEKSIVKGMSKKTKCFDLEHFKVNSLHKLKNSETRTESPHFSSDIRVTTETESFTVTSFANKKENKNYVNDTEAMKNITFREVKNNEENSSVFLTVINVMTLSGTQSSTVTSLIDTKTNNDNYVNVTKVTKTRTFREDNNNEENSSVFLTVIVIIAPQLFLCIFVIVLFKKQLRKMCYKINPDRDPENMPLQSVEIESKNNMYIKKANFLEILYRKLENHEFNEEFSTLPAFADKTLAALRNKNKNRNSIRINLPYDHNRVILKELDGVGTGDYINASYIDGFNRSRAYIASQGPKFSTLKDFWRMIWQENIELIIMATNFMTDNAKNRLCAEYLPSGLDAVFECGRITVTLVDELNCGNYVKRKLTVRYSEYQREIWHIHINWRSECQLLYPNDLISVIKEIKKLYEKTLHPILIHSGFGTTRTGLFILCDMALKMLEQCNAVNVYDLAEKLRKQRYNVINSMQQYILAHLVVAEYIMEEEYRSKSLHTNHYENIGENLKNQLIYLKKLCEHDKIVHRWMPQATKYTFPTVFVDSYEKYEKYILTPQPITNDENKFAEFWILLAEKSIDCIVFLNKMKKSLQLYPCRIEYENVIVKVECIKITKPCTYTLRTMSLLIYDKASKKIEHQKEVVFYELKERAIFACKILLTLLCEVKKFKKIALSCNDEFKMCGLFLVLAYIIEKYETELKLDVINAVRVARRSGTEFLDTTKQLQRVYLCIREYLKNFQRYNFIDDNCSSTQASTFV